MTSCAAGRVAITDGGAVVLLPGQPALIDEGCPAGVRAGPTMIALSRSDHVSVQVSPD